MPAGTHPMQIHALVAPQAPSYPPQRAAVSEHRDNNENLRRELRRRSRGPAASSGGRGDPGAAPWTPPAFAACCCLTSASSSAATWRARRILPKRTRQAAVASSPATLLPCVHTDAAALTLSRSKYLCNGGSLAANARARVESASTAVACSSLRVRFHSLSGL